LQEIRTKPIVQLRKYCYRRNKPEAGQSSGLRWSFFISSNWKIYHELKWILLKHAHPVA